MCIKSTDIAIFSEKTFKDLLFHLKIINPLYINKKCFVKNTYIFQMKNGEE